MHYLDNSSTTQPSKIALEAAFTAASTWGNPSSTHILGMEAKKLLEESRQKIRRTFSLPKFSNDHIIFTSSGTEANNIALLGCAKSKTRPQNTPGTLILSAGEHPSVDECARLLEKDGYNIARIPTTGGILDLTTLESTLQNAKTSNSPVVWAAFMLVNNETGAVYNVKSASALVKQYFPDANVHCDAVQAYLKMKFTPTSLGADTISVSAHKIHSIRGAGALYVSANIIKRKNITAVMPGGGQEYSYRSGTENLVSIAAFAAAAEDGYNRLPERTAHLAHLRHLLDSQITENLIPLGVKLNLPKNPSDAILNLSLPGIRSEIMLNHLSGKGICVSAGSACAANSKKKSLSLLSFGCTESEADCAIRVSLGDFNTPDDIIALTTAIKSAIPSLQKTR